MNTVIRKMTPSDRTAVIDMMRAFYTSPAVSTNGSEEIYARNFQNCIAENPCLEGYIFEGNGDMQGYSIIAKSYATEYGCTCIWIEDLYLTEVNRGQGIGSHFLNFIRQKYPDALLRLEVEEENQSAIYTYKKCGFEFWPYLEMKNDPR
jgi:GNAT superfamily N-acetyltransferase